MWVGLYTKALLLVHREIIKKVIYFHTHAGFRNLPCIVGSVTSTGPLYCLGFSQIKNTLPEVIACIRYPPNTLRNFSKCSTNKIYIIVSNPS
jgi:hypothetical protein